MRRAFLLVLGCALLAGCATGGKRAAAAKSADSLAPDPVAIIGHVIAVDPALHTVVIDVAPFAVLPLDYDRKILFTRTDDLRLTARLQAAPVLRGHILGARLLAGHPSIGDEVVLPPPASR